ADVGHVVGEPSAAKYTASRGLQDALRPFEHGHVVSAASRLEDASDHRDEEHLADAPGIGGVLDAKTVREPCREPRPAVPSKRREIIAHWMEGVIVGIPVDGLMRRVLAKATKSKPLEPFLHGGHVGVS